uniref:Uncharacterized protein n=1 Tax=Panagrolaimus sp. JU765 TaxID=591449 RepID=A0AC34QR17_9BILA
MNEEKFWSQALGAWIKDCVCGPSAIIPEKTWRIVDCVPLKFAEICDGFVLNLLLFFIEPNLSDRSILKFQPTFDRTLDSKSKLKLFHLLLRNLYSFYKNQLNRVITMDSSPDLLSIIKNPVPGKISPFLTLKKKSRVYHFWGEKFVDIAAAL